MGDLMGSFPSRARVRPKCVGTTCVGLWGQSKVSLSNHWRSKGSSCYTCTQVVKQPFTIVPLTRNNYAMATKLTCFTGYRSFKIVKLS